MNSHRFSVYLAGPEVFLPDAHEVLAAKIQRCEKLGFLGLSPFDNEVDPHQPASDIAQTIFRANLAMMDKADAMIANITAFRGPHMDPGTAFEVGYFKALGKPMMLYSQDGQGLVERVTFWSKDTRQDGVHLRDRQGHAIENFGLHENLMIDLAGTQEAFFPRVAVSDVPEDQKIRSMKGFDEALRHLRAHILQPIVERAAKTQEAYGAWKANGTRRP